MATPDPKPTSLIPPAISPARESENYCVKQTGTRLTETEFDEAEAAATREGMSVSALDTRGNTRQIERRS